MKKLLLLALCALLSASAGARTLYVDAKRPNNSGNGLSKAKAKMTIQAAINVAQAGDTILVYPGTYAPIKTKNKKIAIKSVSGKAQTRIRPDDYVVETTVLNLGDGTATKVVGFTVTPGWENEMATYGFSAGVQGGTVQKCTFDSVGMIGIPTFSKTSLAVCVLKDCYPSEKAVFATGCTMNRCKILATQYSSAKFLSCKIYNTLLAESWASVRLSGCVFVNDTFANNPDFRMAKSKAFNTIFFGVAAAQFDASRQNKFSKCCKSATPGFVAPVPTDVPDEDGNGYTVVPANYHLKKGARCIDKGNLTKEQQALIGSKDLGGGKRIKGAAVDVGCYEY